MRVAIVISRKMPAALNIKEKLLGLCRFENAGAGIDGNDAYTARIGDNDVVMHTVEENAVFLEGIDKKLSSDLIIFPTTHKSSAGVPSLTCHVPGNWGKAGLGGRDRQLCISPSQFLKEIFLELNKHGVEGFEVSLEQTHHGPYLDTPAVFVEIGSSEKEWANDDAGMAVAKTILAALARETKKQKAVVVLGGQHYNQAANKILQRTDYSVSHICAKHCLADLEEEMLKQAAIKSTAQFGMIVLDWKGLGQHKEKVKDMVKRLDMACERISKLI